MTNSLLFIVFPNQLFEDLPAVLSRANMAHADIAVVEEPLYFYDPAARPYKINQLKIAFHRASMRAYYDWLKSKVRGHVMYVDYKDALGSFAKKRPLAFIDPIDHAVMRKYASATPTVLQDTPAFLMGQDDLKAFHRKSTRHAAFFAMVKSKLGILVNTPSQDVDNRNPLPKGWTPDAKRHALPTYPTSAYVKEAMAYVKAHPQFKKHYGTTDHLVHYPITHAQAKQHLATFIKNRLKDFGTTQDAMYSSTDDASVVLNHAHISCALNAGLLTPQEVLAAVQKVKRSVPMNSYEGFVRQVAGWREYMRYLYMFHEAHLREMDRGTHGTHTRDHTSIKAWYTGETGIAPLDREIKKAMAFGYAHHIVRLMVFLNIMVMCGIKASSIVQWFMEVVSIDAYEWVMVSNIVAMGGFSTRFMRKAYLSTSNYIRTMSSNDYKTKQSQEEGGADVWNALFYHAISKHKHANVYARHKKHATPQHLSTAQSFIKEFTTQ